MGKFNIATVEVAAPRTSRRVVDEEYREVFDAVAALDEGKGATVTFEDEAQFLAAKGTVQALANDAGFTARVQRTTIERDPKTGAVTATFLKRPRQRGKGTTEAVAPAE